jgi:hypothetical protein
MFRLRHTSYSCTSAHSAVKTLPRIGREGAGIHP